MPVSRRTLAALGVVGALTAGVTIPALAQDGSGTPTAPDQQAQQDLRAEHEAEFAQRLADELGLDESTVSDAIGKVREQMQAEARTQRLSDLKDRLDQAVADGDLTQEQADALYQAAQTGALGALRGLEGPRFGHHRRGGFGPGFGRGFGPPPADDAPADATGSSA